MTIRTRGPAWVIVIAAIAAAAVISTADSRELRGPASESGEPRDLVNSSDCWADGVANGWQHCLFE